MDDKEILELLSVSTVARFKELSESPPPTLMVLESSLVGLAQNTAQALAKGWLDEDSFLRDVRVVSPKSDRWSVNEVQEAIIDPSTMMPNERNVIIVENASMMDSSASEKLLKTVEEPLSVTTFIFCVGDARDLLVTIRGRSGVTFKLEPAPIDTRVQALVRAGHSQEDAIHAVRVAGNQVQLAPLMLSNPAIMAAATEGFNLKGIRSTPLLHAQKVNTNLSILANASLSGGSKTSDKLDAVSRSALRVLCRELIARAREMVRVDGSNLSSSKMRYTAQILKASSLAERELALYGSVPTILSSFFSTISQNPED